MALPILMAHSPMLGATYVKFKIPVNQPMLPGIGKVAPREIAIAAALKRAVEVEPRANTNDIGGSSIEPSIGEYTNGFLPAEDMPDYDRDPPHWWFELMSSHDSDKM